MTNGQQQGDSARSSFWGSWKKVMAYFVVPVVVAVVSGVIVLVIQLSVDPGGNVSVAPEPNPEASPNPSPSASSEPEPEGDPVDVQSLELTFDMLDMSRGWVTEEVIDLSPAEQTYFPETAPPDPNAESDMSTTERMVEYDASMIGEIHFDLVLAGARSEGVRIMDMRARPECSDPAAGTLFYMPPAGLDEKQSIAFYLEEAEPRARIMEVYGEWGDYYFDNYTYHLAEGEQVVFDVMVFVDNYACDFAIELDLLVDGERETQVITGTDDVTFWVSGVEQNLNYGAYYASGIVTGQGRLSRVDGDVELIDSMRESLTPGAN